MGAHSDIRVVRVNSTKTPVGDEAFASRNLDTARILGTIPDHAMLSQ